MESNANTDVDKLITFGQMALEQGWYDQAHDYFQQALVLDPSNREAMKGLARTNEMLSRREAVERMLQDEPVKPPPRVERAPSIQQPRPEERRRAPIEAPIEKSRLDRRGNSMESNADDNLEWLSSQLKHVPLKTWIIVLAKIGVAYVVLMVILALIAFVSSLILGQIGISVLEWWRGL